MATKVSSTNAQPVPGGSNLTPPRPSAEEIAVRAHQIFEQRGSLEGFDFDDWLTAERELILAASSKAVAQKSVISAAAAATQRSQK